MLIYPCCFLSFSIGYSLNTSLSHSSGSSIVARGLTGFSRCEPLKVLGNVWPKIQCCRNLVHAEVGISFQKLLKVKTICQELPCLFKMFLTRYSRSIIYISNFSRQKSGSYFLICSRVRMFRSLFRSRSKKWYHTLFLSFLLSSMSPVNQCTNSKKLNVM